MMTSVVVDILIPAIALLFAAAIMPAFCD
jgi:hypothetical protein